jgi:beta-glucosidase
VSILEGVRTKLGTGVTVEYAEGVRITEDSTFTKEPQPHMGGTRSHQRWSTDVVVMADSASNAARIQTAVALARQSDVVILVVGDNEFTSREAYDETHLGDRASLGLPGHQDQLVRAIAATGKKVVLVLMNGRPASIPDLVPLVPAIVEGWYLGQETGTAMADVLFGDVNPSGKLPLTIARDVGQLPIFYNRKPTALRGYIFGEIDPLYPFGFGLSYTTFAYSEPRIERDRMAIDGRTTVSVDVRNTGARAGDEIVQLYIRDRVSSVTRPVKELKGFQRISLQPGASRTVTFEIGPDQLSYHGLEMKRVVEPGWFDIMVGSSSVDVKTVPLEVVVGMGGAAR